MSADPPQPGAEPTAIDRILAALAGEFRRRVPAHFEASADETASMDNLVGHVATRRDGAATPAPSCVRVRLHRVDLPKQEAGGLLGDDVEAGVVSYRGAPAAIGDGARPRLAGGAGVA